MKSSSVLIGSHLYYLHWNDVVERGEFKSVIFVMHGRLSSHASVEAYCERIVKECDNVIDLVVSFDNANHGSRLVELENNKTWMEGNVTHAVDMHSQIVSSNLSIKLAIDYLPAYLNQSPFEKVSVTGVSQGGHAAIYAFYDNPTIQCCASIIGTCNYIGLMEYRYENLKGEKKPFNVYFPNALKQSIEKFQKEKYFSNKNKIILLNGLEDKVRVLKKSSVVINKQAKLVPHFLNEPFADVLKFEKKLYKAKHEFTKEMEDDAILFLRSNV